MRWALVIVLAMGSMAYGQVSPEEAAKRLQDKAAARQAERAKAVSITQGELDDLKAEIARLKSELTQAKISQTTNAPGAAAVKMPQSITAGITKDQLLKYVQVHKAQYAITGDIPGPGDPNRNNVTISVKAKRKVFTGIGSNGIARVADYHEEMRPDSTLEVTLMNGTVATVNETKVPLQRDERDPLH